MTEQLSMRTHPDIEMLHARYETASETLPAQFIGGTTFLAGLYLAISPWVVGFEGQTALLMSNLVCGLGVAILGLGLTASFDRMHRMAWTVPIIGLWTMVSQWVIRTGDLASADNIWNNLITGAVLLLCGLAMLAMAMGRYATSSWQETPGPAMPSR